MLSFTFWEEHFLKLLHTLHILSMCVSVTQVMCNSLFQSCSGSVTSLSPEKITLSWRKCTTKWFTCVFPGPCVIVCGFLITPFGSPLFWFLVRLITVHSTDHTSCLLKFFCYIIVSAQEPPACFSPHCSPGLISLFTMEQSGFCV